MDTKNVKTGKGKPENIDIPDDDMVSSIMNSSSMGESEHINIRKKSRNEDFLSPIRKSKKPSILKSSAEGKEISKFGSNDKVIK